VEEKKTVIGFWSLIAKRLLRQADLLAKGFQPQDQREAAYSIPNS
jgi:hypothetical protein